MSSATDDGKTHPNPALQRRIDEGRERFRTLPEPPGPEDLTTTHDVTPGPDPEGGRDAERDWLLRYGDG